MSTGCQRLTYPYAIETGRNSSELLEGRRYMAAENSSQEERHSNNTNRLLEHFHVIRRIVPKDQDVQFVPPDATARDAIAKMNAHGYSQLPVESDGVVQGIFSYRAFALEAMRYSDSREDLGALRVKEFLAHEKRAFAPFQEHYQNTIEILDRNDCVIVSGPHNLEAILTPMDVLRYLDTIVEHYVIIGEIERTLRSVAKAALSTEAEVQGAIERALSSKYNAETMPQGLDDLTFNDLATLICDGRNWNKFRPILGEARKRTLSRLKRVREIRNDLFHFRGELSGDKKDDLASCRRWLSSCCM